MRVHLHRLKHLDDLHNAAGEKIKLAEYVHLGEFEFPLVGLILKLCLGLVEAALVLLIQSDAVLQGL